MKQIDVSQTVSILANLGVVVGIAFLAFELNQNNEQLTAQSRFNYYQNRVASYHELAGNGDLAQLVQQANAGAELSVGEQMRVTNRIFAIITSWEYEFGELERGRLTAEEFNAPAKKAVFLVLRGAMVPVWNGYRGSAPRGFVEYMDENVFAE